jgi:SDR family mycofactocin-dependent oxidoreductase
VVVCDIAEQMSSVPYPMATEDDLQETAAEVEKLDRRCVAVKADTRSAADMRGLVDTALSELGKIDVVAVTHGIGTVADWDCTEEQFDDILDVNLKGVWQVCKAVIPHLIERGQGGSIVLTSSAAGLQAFTGMVPYVAAKHGVIGLMRILSAELAPHWIRVNVVCPGVVDTPMIMNDSLLSLFSGKETGGTREEAAFASQSLGLLPTPWLEPRDLANAVTWLSSEQARFITGVALPVDLGMNNQPAGIPPIAIQAMLGGAS